MILCVQAMETINKHNFTIMEDQKNKFLYFVPVSKIIIVQRFIQTAFSKSDLRRVSWLKQERYNMVRQRPWKDKVRRLSSRFWGKKVTTGKATVWGTEIGVKRRSKICFLFTLYSNDSVFYWLFIFWMTFGESFRGLQ